MASTTDTSRDPRMLAPDQLCATCAAPLAADQRYCLNCGRRLRGREDLLRALAPGGVRETTTSTTTEVAGVIPPTPRSVTPWGAAAAAALLLLAGLGGALVAGGDPPRAPDIRVAAAPQPNVNVTGPGGGAGAAQAEFVGDWAGEDGWTVQLQTLAKDSADPAQVAAAKTAAESAGADDVGALDSDEYPSLDSGQYVVYSGVFETKKAATKSLRSLKKEFPDAEVVKVSSAGDGGAAPKVEKDAAEQSDDELKDLQSAKGDDFVKKSKKLPDKVGTQGAAPKTDNKKPGGGSGGGTVLE